MARVCDCLVQLAANRGGAEFIGCGMRGWWSSGRGLPAEGLRVHSSRRRPCNVHAWVKQHMARLHVEGRAAGSRGRCPASSSQPRARAGGPSLSVGVESHWAGTRCYTLCWARSKHTADRRREENLGLLKFIAAGAGVCTTTAPGTAYAIRSNSSVGEFLPAACTNRPVKSTNQVQKMRQPPNQARGQYQRSAAAAMCYGWVFAPERRRRIAGGWVAV